MVVRCVMYVDSFLSEGSNPLEWALGNAFNVVLRARKKRKKTLHTFWIITCWCFSNIHLKGYLLFIMYSAFQSSAFH